MKISVETLFDCSTTGTTGNFRPASLPYHDRINNEIRDYATWARSRNQQRNWETLLQVLGLRCQLVEIQPSSYRDGRWHFSFEIENDAVFGSDLELLKRDCHGVPMVSLAQESPTAATVSCHGPDQNIWFTAVNT
jgi:hypothetical protein